MLRKSLQQLEAAGLIIHDKTGRRVSPAGMAFLDNLSQEVKITPPAPVPKRVKAVAEPEAKKADTKKKAKGGDKAAAPEGADGAKAEKKTSKKKSEKTEAPQ